MTAEWGLDDLFGEQEDFGDDELGLAAAADDGLQVVIEVLGDHVGTADAAVALLEERGAEGAEWDLGHERRGMKGEA
jgi:hypothetical protein